VNVGEPGVTEPEVTDPEVTDPEFTDPEATNPEAGDAEVTDEESGPVDADRSEGDPELVMLVDTETSAVALAMVLAMVLAGDDELPPLLAGSRVGHPETVNSLAEVLLRSRYLLTPYRRQEYWGTGCGWYRKEINVDLIRLTIQAQSSSTIINQKQLVFSTGSMNQKVPKWW